MVVALYVLLSRSGASGPFDTLANVPSSPGSYGWLVTLPATSGAFIKVVAFDANGNSGEDLSDAPFTIIARSTGAGTAIPRELALGVIFPNPAAGPARIPYDLPREARVRLSVADVQGREMTLLEDRACAAGRHVAIWDGRTRGDRASSRAGDFVEGEHVEDGHRMVVEHRRSERRHAADRRGVAAGVDARDVVHETGVAEAADKAVVAQGPRDVFQSAEVVAGAVLG